jgi:2-polyprenyl-6-methoxyphenol hydroxylase-like FAD-dependent oxidoreductase
MCDAIALAKAISAHIENEDTQPLLSYSVSRRARAIQVVELASSSMSTLVRLMDSTFLRRWIFRHILDRLGFLKYQVIWQLSGLGANTTVAK